jgi:hypothetical protein
MIKLLVINIYITLLLAACRCSDYPVQQCVTIDIQNTYSYVAGFKSVSSLFQVSVKILAW